MFPVLRERKREGEKEGKKEGGKKKEGRERKGERVQTTHSPEEETKAQEVHKTYQLHTASQS